MMRQHVSTKSIYWLVPVCCGVYSPIVQAAFGDVPDVHAVMHEHFFASATNLPFDVFVHKCRPLVVDPLTCVRSISVEKMIILCAHASSVAVTDKDASVRALAATVV